MSKDLTIFLGDHPGSLAKVGEALGKADVNIEGICGVTLQGKGVIHVLVADGSKARRALEANHVDVVKETDVVVVPVEDRPGALGNVARRLANAGVNLQLAYLATSTRLVVGADDLEKVRATMEAKKPA
ncbi:MAG: amino acid-binding protein [Zetaproteobacteria bacterium]|jgi:hypothetical protein|nr:MAG: amino acid-binding protein [Zetaproteobacteria bacterium]